MPTATASSPLPFPPPGSSSLSCLGPDSPSPRAPWPASGVGPDSRPRVTLLPPFLSDQAQHVHALGTFHLFCQATGPADVHVLWEKNGRALEACVPTQTHTLPDGRALVLSWLRDAIREGAEYRCSALSTAGSQTSRVPIAGAHRRDGTRGDPPREVDQRARRLEGRGRGARPHGAELEEGVDPLVLKLGPFLRSSTHFRPVTSRIRCAAHLANRCRSGPQSITARDIVFDTLAQLPCNANASPEQQVL
ncbi:hypothetical protein CB1_000293012 [Camelus ferus]|nr:hypothetical protein CB1_000293012 [Camelus ferus]